MSANVGVSERFERMYVFLQSNSDIIVLQIRLTHNMLEALVPSHSAPLSSVLTKDEFAVVRSVAGQGEAFRLTIPSARYTWRATYSQEATSPPDLSESKHVFRQGQTVRDVSLVISTEDPNRLLNDAGSGTVYILKLNGNPFHFDTLPSQSPSEALAGMIGDRTMGRAVDEGIFRYDPHTTDVDRFTANQICFDPSWTPGRLIDPMNETWVNVKARLEGHVHRIYPKIADVGHTPLVLHYKSSIAPGELAHMNWSDLMSGALKSLSVVTPLKPFQGGWAAAVSGKWHNVHLYGSSTGQSAGLQYAKARLVAALVGSGTPSETSQLLLRGKDGVKSCIKELLECSAPDKIAQNLTLAKSTSTFKRYEPPSLRTKHTYEGLMEQQTEEGSSYVPARFALDLHLQCAFIPAEE